MSMPTGEQIGTVFSTLVPRIALDLACVLVIVRGVYLKKYPRREYGFTFALLNLITFSVTYMLSNVRVEMGLALGLFGVFGILRYRTEALRIRDLTYLFVVIGIGMLNGVAGSSLDIVRVLLVDALVTAAVALLELGRWGSGEDTLVVRYDRLELLAPQRRGALLADLSERLGVRCERVAVGTVDLMHDSAELIVTYRQEPAADARAA